MASRQTIPQYAEYGSITLTKWQFLTICKRGEGRRKILQSYNAAVRVTQTKDKKVWVEWKGDTVFWASRWYEVPAVTWERAQKIDAFVKGLV